LASVTALLLGHRKTINKHEIFIRLAYVVLLLS